MDKSLFILGSNFAELWDELGLSQKDFALLVNISSTTLINIESGRDNFKISSLDRILNFVSMNLDELSLSTFKSTIKLRESIMANIEGIRKYQSFLPKNHQFQTVLNPSSLRVTFWINQEKYKAFRKALMGNFGRFDSYLIK